MKKYTVNKYEKIDHDGKRFVDGEEITGLSAKDAERLLRLGVIVANGEDQDEQEAELVEPIVDAEPEEKPKAKTSAKAKKDDA